MNELTSIYVLTEFTDGDFDCVRLFSTEAAMLKAAASSLINEYANPDNKQLAISSNPSAEGKAVFDQVYEEWVTLFNQGEDFYENVVESFHAYIEEHVHNHPMPYGLECEEQLLEDLQPEESYIAGTT